MSPLFNFEYLHRQARYGNAILSRYSVKQKKTIFTHQNFIEDFDDNLHDYNIRNFQHVLIKTPSGALNIVNHHGYHVPEHKNGNTETLKQTAKIANYIKKLTGPTIMAGDFNLLPSSDSIRQINLILRNLSIEAGLKTTRNKLKTRQEVCDYVFVNGEIKVNRFYASKEMVSDHLALFLDFDL